MRTLDEICIRNHTDKASQYTIIEGQNHGHNYAPVYDLHFTPFREKQIRIMEIGVAGGESIKSWLEYFPLVKLFGVDIVHDTNEWNTKAMSPDSRYQFIEGDQSNADFWKGVVADSGGDWDVIIDDGSHINRDIVTSYASLWPHLKPGGLYCIEDLAVAYNPIYSVDGFPNHMDFIKVMLDQINASSEIESLHFSKELAIIRKKESPS